MIAAAMARAMPVLPEVASISVSPGWISPRCSARRIIDSAGRSLTEPAGLLPSSFSRMVLLVAPVMRCRRTRGVLPTVSAMVGNSLVIVHPSTGTNRVNCPGGAFQSMITATGKGMHILNKSAMKRQPTLGIKARLLLMTLLPTALIAAVLGGYFSWQQLRDTEQQLLQRGLMTIEYLQLPAASALLDGQFESIGATLYAALNYTDVRALALYDADMRLLERRGPNMHPAGQQLTDVQLAAGTGLQIHRSKHSSRFMLPLLASAELPQRQSYRHIEPDSLLGWLEVELSHGN